MKYITLDKINYNDTTFIYDLINNIDNYTIMHIEDFTSIYAVKKIKLFCNVAYKKYYRFLKKIFINYEFFISLKDSDEYMKCAVIIHIFNIYCNREITRRIINKYINTDVTNLIMYFIEDKTCSEVMD